jgi:hypothetical protein
MSARKRVPKTRSAAEEPVRPGYSTLLLCKDVKKGIEYDE